MLCNSVRAVFVGALFTHAVGWLEVFVLSLKKCTNRQDLKNAENSSCSSSNGFGPTLTTMTKLFAGWPAILTKLSAGFPATLCRTSNLFWGQPRGCVLHCPQSVVLLAVLLIDCEAWLYILLGSLPGARRAIVCILFSLEQSRVVDSVFAEVLLHLA